MTGEVDKLPGWRRLYEAILAHGVEPGAFFADDWIDHELGLNAADANDLDSAKEYNLKRLRGLDTVREQLRTNAQRTLLRDSERGGYFVPDAKEQFETAMHRLVSEQRAAIRHAVNDLGGLDRQQLSAADLAKVDDATVKIADLRSFSRRQTFALHKLLPKPDKT